MHVMLRGVTFCLAIISWSAASAEPTYIGPYKYYSERCEAKYGPFTSEEEAVNVGAKAIYEMGCGWSIKSSSWATQAKPVGICGGIAYPTFVEGVETEGHAQYNIQFGSAPNCNITSVDSLLVSRFRTVCPSGQLYFEDWQRCGTVQLQDPETGPVSDPKNNGVVCPDCSRGDPVNPVNGNNWRIDVDYTTVVQGGLGFARTYNSSMNNPDADQLRAIGSRWTHNYDKRLNKISIASTRVQIDCYLRWTDKKSFCLGPTSDSASMDIAATREDGKIFYFKWDGEHYISDQDVNASLQLQRDASNTITGWRYASANGNIEFYDAMGRLVQILQMQGTNLYFTYSDGTTNNSTGGRLPMSAPSCSHIQAGQPLVPGRLICVTDNWGRQLQFEYDSKGRITSLFDPAGLQTKYAYDGLSGGCNAAVNISSLACASNNLTSVTHPDGKVLTYWYNELTRINNGTACMSVINSGSGFGHLVRSMTGITDENSDRSATWGYNCAGQVIENFIGDGVAKVTFDFGGYSSGTRSTTVTASYGDAAAPVTEASTYQFKTVLGTGKNSAVSQRCAHCGQIMSRTYDTHGNVASEKNWNGLIVNYSYDLSRNLEVKRVEAPGTALERTTSTSWHPSLRLKTVVVEPKRVSTFDYDDFGNLTKKTVQATSDQTGAMGVMADRIGAVLTWQYTYSTIGQLTSVFAPGQKIPTRYTYDSAGNLSTQVNSVRHLTTFDSYDANGRIGKIVYPNGVVQNLTYSSRGLLADDVIDGLHTSYTYDNAGQLKQRNLPSGDYLAYSYDSAHRLIGLRDRVGNQILFKLDLVGNRIEERVIGNANVLSRKVVRTYDTKNQLLAVTGTME